MQIVIAGDMTAAKALRDTAIQAAPPTRLILSVPPGTDLPAGHPATGKGPVNDQPAAYVCVGTTCTLPLTDAKDLEDHLRSL